MNLLFPTMVSSAQGCLVQTFRSKSWEIDYTVLLYKHFDLRAGQGDLVVHMSFARLYKHVMRYFEERFQFHHHSR